jgi:hypothetical protein
MHLASSKLFLLLLLLSCHPNLSGKFPYPKEKLLQESKQILFLTLLSQRDTINDVIQHEIIQFQITDGKLKSFAESSHTKISPGNWSISLLDQKNRIICSQYIQNPLNYEREVYGESGQIELRKIRLSSAQIPLRFPYLPQMKKIQIDSLTLNLEKVTIYRQNFPSTRISK